MSPRKARPRFIKSKKSPRFDRVQGEVSLSGQFLHVQFSFSPDLVAAIKNIPQARFMREEKLWRIPLRHYPALLGSKLFGREALTYTFTEESLSEGLTRTSEDFEQASERYRANPFSVSEKDIELLDLEVVFRLSSKSASLRAATRFRSKAVALVEKIPRAHFIQPEKSYFFPAEELNDFLKSLRDKKLNFAVEEQTAAALSAGAKLRAEILQNQLVPNADDLRAALLGPFADLLPGEDEPRFYFSSYTTQQLRTLFPEAEDYTERKARCSNFGPEELLRLIARARKSGEKLWLTQPVRDFLKEQKDFLRERLESAGGFEEDLLHFVQLPICWAKRDGQPAALLMRRDEFQTRFQEQPDHPLKKFNRQVDPYSAEHLAFLVPEFKLLNFHHAVNSFLRSPVPEGKNFTLLLSELVVRAKRLARRNAFQTMADAQLAVSPEITPGLSAKLYPHQRVAVSWLLENPRAFLGDDMGLGKTLSVLAYFEHLRASGECDFLLVACPNSLTRNWQREAAQWLPSLKPALLPEVKGEKILLLKKIGWGGLLVDGLVLNYEAVRLEYVLEGLKKIIGQRKVLLCLDESQRVKTHTSKTFSAISEIVPLCRRRVLLSGTPTPKDVSDIWAQMYLLDDGERFGGNFYDWLRGVADLGNKYSEYAVKKFRTDDVQNAIARTQEILLRRKKEDVVNLPEKTFAVRDVALRGDQLSRYDEVRKDLLLQMSTHTGKTFTREITNILEQYLRAVQIASNPRLVDENWKGEPAKFLELDDIVNEVVFERDEKIVIWTNYLGNVNELTARYKKLGSAAFSGEVSTAGRDKTLREFQQGKDLKVLIAVPAAGGVGITLTAAQTAVYLDKTWNAEHWLQSIDRIHRIGQRGTVSIVSLHACRIDELIAANLTRKTIQQAKVLGDLPATMQEEANFAIYPAREELLAALDPQG